MPSSSSSSEATETTEPVSSISDSSPEEQTVASCLLMLSGDKRVDEEVVVTNDVESEEVIRDSLKCGTCDKSFRSYEALGGHRGSHKRTKLMNRELEVKVHECPVCFKVFASGQALGGHKSGSGHSATAKHSKQSMNLFDLNLPAPPDDAAADDDKLKLV